MFIKKTVNSAGKTYYHLVESYREAKRVRQRTLLALGEASVGKLEQLAQAIAKHLDVLTAIQLAKDVCIDQTYILGPLLILEKMFERLGINECLKGIQDEHQQIRYDFCKSVFTLVASRFVRPSSKLWIFDNLLERFYPEKVDHQMPLHVLYRTLDLLVAHKDEIETKLYWKRQDLFSREIEVIFYDLTTLRFESVREDMGQLRRFGYSKEKRNDCTQVVLGLLLDSEGIPIGFEAYPGNTFEGKTLPGIVEKLKKKYRIRRIIFIADRGLLSSGNIDLLRKDGGEFIVGMKLGQLRSEENIYDLGSYQWINENLAVRETTQGTDRVIVTWSKTRAERDSLAREDKLDKIRKLLSQKRVNAKKFVTNQTYQRYVEGLDEGAPKLNEKAICEDAAHDGFFGILTNVKTLSAKELVGQYKQLWKIEDAFGELKGTLKTRPIFHWKDERIIGHLVLCFLSFFCEAHMAKALRKKGSELKSKSVRQDIIDTRQLTPAMAMEQVAQVRAIPIKVKGQKTLWVRTDISGASAELFKSLGIAIPPKVLDFKESKNVVAQTESVCVTPSAQSVQIS